MSAVARVVRSPLFYVGDKRKLVPQLLEIFPRKIDQFVEPFAGGGSVSLNVKANSFRLNDFDVWVSELHKWLGNPDRFDALILDLRKRIDLHGLKSTYFGYEVPAVLKNEFPKTYFAEINKDAFLKMRTKFNSENTFDPVDLYLLIIYGFNRMIRRNAKGEFNVPVGNVDFNQNVADAIFAYKEWSSTNEIAVSNLDFREFLGKIERKSETFVYIDPPYLLASAEYNKGWGPSDDIDLYGLLDELDAAKVKWALSNVLTYKDATNTILEKWSRKYMVHGISANYINYFDNTDKLPGEVLVTNYVR